MKILIIEDDKTIVEIVANFLAELGHEVESAMLGEEGLRLALEKSFDLIILDLMLPDIDGVQILEEVKASGVKTPIIVLSARQDIEDKVLCLNKGSDDYMTKPFALTELVARINAIVRRNTTTEDSTRLVRESVTVDLIQRKAWRDDVEIDLKSREFSLLVYLMENAGKVVTRAMIIKHVWGYDFDPGTNIIDVYVCQLRDKIDGKFDQKLIHTVRGSGYVFRKG